MINVLYIYYISRFISWGYRYLFCQFLKGIHCQNKCLASFWQYVSQTRLHWKELFLFSNTINNCLMSGYFFELMLHYFFAFQFQNVTLFKILFNCCWKCYEKRKQYKTMLTKFTYRYLFIYTKIPNDLTKMLNIKSGFLLRKIQCAYESLKPEFSQITLNIFIFFYCRV